MCSIGDQKPGATVRRIPKSAPIVAYRYWRVRRTWSDKPQLVSLHRDTEWRRRPMVADAAVLPESYYGDPFGKAGFYAYRTKAEALADSGSVPDGETIVLGTVELWGDVVEHKRGFRAQRARVRSLDRIGRAAYVNYSYVLTWTGRTRAMRNLLAKVRARFRVNGAPVSA